MDKESLRKMYRLRRKELSAEQVGVFSRAILWRFKSLSLDGVRCVHVFLPIEAMREPDTYPLIRYLWQKGVCTLIPRCEKDGCRLSHFVLDEKTPLQMNKWGIPEPDPDPDGEGRVGDLSRIDMVLVPLLAYDRAGNRIGYGKGFYDRFLKECSPRCLKVGLSFFPPEERIEGVEADDVPLDMCLTPERIYDFRPGR